MSRLPRLHDVWSWLPAFRAVAETEHLPAAAAQLHVVPSALSRSVRLLEEAVGEPLFVRTGRRIVLNHRGRALLGALQRGMREIERELTAAGPLEGELRVSTLGVITNHVVLPVLLELAGEHPGMVPVMKNLKASEAAHRLVASDLDVAFFYDAVPMAGVACRRLGALTNSVYCGRRHPLFARRRVPRQELLRHPFSVPSIGDRNTPMDNWPVHLDRRVGFRIELLWTNLEVSLSGRYVTVLPDVVALPYVRRRELRLLATDLVPETDVYAAAREEDESRPEVTLLRSAVSLRLESIRAEVARLRR